VGAPAGRVSGPPGSGSAALAAAGDLDVLVVGGGITGACVALEAARRGLRTGLVERGDFGGGATANCLKIVHGGLRYLQRLDVRRARASAQARSEWLRSAPHLVEPLPVLLPTYRGRFPPRAALAAALPLNEFLSRDRNEDVLPERQIPAARLLSAREVVELEPLAGGPGLTGGVLFHDALIHSPERLALEVVQAARAAGALALSRVEFLGPIIDRGQVAGARLRAAGSGDGLEVRCRWIVNAAGSASSTLAARFGDEAAAAQRYSVALNVVTRLPARRVAFGAAGAGGRLFVVPWRGQSMVGTDHVEYCGDPATFSLQPEHVERFVDRVRAAVPELGLDASQVAVVHAGLLPVSGGPTALLGRHRIIDHAGHGCAGAFSVVTVKLTTAADVARELVARLRPAAAGPAGGRLPLPGGRLASLAALRSEASARLGGLLPEDVIEHLVRTYGARWPAVLENGERVDGWQERVVAGAPVIRAQLVHGAVAEDAVTAEDLLWRRTELGARGLVDEAARRAAEEALAAAHQPADRAPAPVRTRGGG
jgi:glycerol-3-phosphate dehydrogenase